MEDPILNYTLLETVDDHTGQLTQRDMSRRLGRSVASVNFALRLLAAKGYIKISGANKRNIRYHLTPSGIIQKSILAYNFLQRQRALYEEVRNGLIGQLEELKAEKTGSAAVYGWTPVTESAILFLISEGIKVPALYVDKWDGIMHCNRIPVRLIENFCGDCDVLVLIEPLPKFALEKVIVRTVACFPDEVRLMDPEQL